MNDQPETKVYHVLIDGKHDRVLVDGKEMNSTEYVAFVRKLKASGSKYKIEHTACMHAFHEVSTIKCVRGGGYFYIHHGGYVGDNSGVNFQKLNTP